MSMLARLANTGGGTKTYVDDVFSTWLYTGTGAAQTITNGIDLSGKGGMVWIKNRTRATSGHVLFDTNRTSTYFLTPSGHEGYLTSTAAQQWNGSDLSFTNSGFSVGTDTANSATNYYIQPYVSWTFRKAAKFFDVVTYTGNGLNDRTLAHALGSAPGMVVVKATSTSGDWWCWHRSLGSFEYLKLNSTNAAASAIGAPSPIFGDASNFYVHQADPGLESTYPYWTLNASGVTYVAYLFAHDTATDGIIQCGSFTTDGSGNATVNLGWEPQFVIAKARSAVAEWKMLDTMRGWSATTASNALLRPNTSAAELAGQSDIGFPTATGIDVKGLSASTTYIYLAIRRPNKPPTTGTQVYNAIARTGTAAAATVTGAGFAPDLVIAQSRSISAGDVFYDRLRGQTKSLFSYNTATELSASDGITSFNIDGISLGADSVGQINQSGVAYINWLYRRAPGVFDVVCTSDASSSTPHNLGVAPELIIGKTRNINSGWGSYVYNGVSRLGGPGINSSAVPVSVAAGSNVNTSTTFNAYYIFDSAGNSISSVSYPTGNFVYYLFATSPGISKVFSYTGNGTSQTINCGFTTGARFVLIKRTDSTGDWYVWDTARGIIAANDPHLSLNTTAAEVTTNDSIDTDSTGFVVNQLAATNINVTSATYIGLAFA